jgi:hypothetical protein
MIAPNSEKGKAAMATHFENFKLSFIWVETIPAIGEQRLGDKTPWGFLGMPGQFAKKFADLKAANGGTSELQIPWRKPRGSVSGNTILRDNMRVISPVTLRGGTAYPCAARAQYR